MCMHMCMYVCLFVYVCACVCACVKYCLEFSSHQITAGLYKNMQIQQQIDIITERQVVCILIQM